MTMYRVAASLLAAGSLSMPSAAFLQSAVKFNVRRMSYLDVMAGPAFCEICGHKTQIKIPDGDERERSVCGDPQCGHITYQNPKVVVGCICTYKKEVLLCRRAIEPCIGKWGYPQGFLELGETTRQGAARESFEEAGVKFDPRKSDLLAIYNLAGMQVQMIYRAELDSNQFQAGRESSDVKFFDWESIPWDELAFPTVNWGLEYARDVKDEANPSVQEKTKLVTMDGKWKVDSLPEVDLKTKKK